jgi:hypothetical protein
MAGKAQIPVVTKKATPATAPVAKGKPAAPIAPKAAVKPAAPVTVVAKPPTPNVKAEGKEDTKAATPTVSPKEIQELRAELKGKDKAIERLTGELKAAQEKIASVKGEEDRAYSAADIMAFPRREAANDWRAPLHGQLFSMYAYAVQKGGKPVEITGEPGIHPVLMTIPSMADPILPGEKRSINAVNYQNGLVHTYDTPGAEEGTFYGPPGALRRMDLVHVVEHYFDAQGHEGYEDGMRYAAPVAYVGEDGTITYYDEGEAPWILIGKTPT